MSYDYGTFESGEALKLGDGGRTMPPPAFEVARPGDCVLVRLPDQMTQEQAERIVDRLKATMPEGIGVVVFGGGVEVLIARNREDR